MNAPMLAAWQHARAMAERTVNDPTRARGVIVAHIASFPRYRGAVIVRTFRGRVLNVEVRPNSAQPIIGQAASFGPDGLASVKVAP